MGLKERVMALLQTGGHETLAEIVASDKRAVRHLTGRLWDPDARIRRSAAVALGIAAEEHPDLGTEVIRRMMWALNDESGTNGMYGLAALGEIGRKVPDLIAPFVPAIASVARDDGLRVEMLRALLAIAESDASLVEPHLARVARSIDRSRPEETELFRRLAEATGGETGHEH
jgi:hypothetical protein